MKSVVEFLLESGGSILIESDMEVPPGAVRIDREHDIPQKATQTFEKSLDTIKAVAQAMVTKIDELVDRPDDLQVEFGIKLSGEVGAIIASAKAEANYTVTLTWRRR